MNNEPIEQEHEDEMKLEQLPLPLEIFTSSRVVRPEYNIGKFAGIIFVSPYARNVKEPRQYEWQIDVEGERIKASLSVVPSHGSKTPTTTTFRIYLALLQIWEHQSKPEDGEITFSARQLCAVVGWRWGGRDTAKRIEEHIKILSGTRLDWVFSYKSDGVLNEQNADMSILQTSNYRSKDTIQKSKLFASIQRVRFNSDLMANMLKGYVRPINYEQFLQIANDTTANLYARIDIYLSSKRKWERRALPLLQQELGLQGKRYEARKARHKALKDFVKQLDGVDLLNGRLRLSIEETADKADWKLVARKQPRREPPKRHIRPIVGKDEAGAIADDLISDILRQDRSGNPRRGYIEFLCTLYPESLLRRALSIAKSDYETVNSTLTGVFVYEVQRLVKEGEKLEWYDPPERKAA